MITKKEYIKFADMIAECKFANICDYQEDDYSKGRQDQMRQIEHDMIELFQSDNPDFDRSRFNSYIEKRVREILDTV